jgi:hypothetical protein
VFVSGLPSAKLFFSMGSALGFFFFQVANGNYSALCLLNGESLQTMSSASLISRRDATFQKGAALDNTTATATTHFSAFCLFKTNLSSWRQTI